MKIKIFENKIPFSFNNSVIHTISKYQISNIGDLNILKKGKIKKGLTNFTNFTHNIESLRLFSNYKNVKLDRIEFLSVIHLHEITFDLSADKNGRNRRKNPQNFMISRIL